jgi:hypothetical protein
MIFLFTILSPTGANSSAIIKHMMKIPDIMDMASWGKAIRKFSKIAGAMLLRGRSR